MTLVPRLRAAELADIPAIASLAAIVWRAHYPGIISDAQIDYMLDRGYAPDALARFIHGPDSGIELAYVDDALAGFAAWLSVDDRRELKLDKLYVDPGRQKGGVGSALIERVLAHARACHAAAVILNVNKRNRQAIAAYRKRGFEVREAVVVDIGGGFVMDDFIMQRPVMIGS